MKNILHVSFPNVYADFLGAPALHPLVSVIHYDEVSPIHSSLNRYGVYGLFIQRNFPKNLTYGMKMFDAPDGSIIAVEPGQIGGKEDKIVTPAASEEISMKIPCSRLIMYDGLGHGLYEEAPDFFRNVLDFCR